MRFDNLRALATVGVCLGLVSVCGAQNAPATQTVDGQKPADQPPRRRCPLLP